MPISLRRRTNVATARCLACVVLASWITASAAAAPKAEAKPSSPLPLKGEAAQACQRLSDRLKAVAPTDCRNSGLVASGGRSRNDFPILVRRFTPPKSRDASSNTLAPARILLIGGIHGDELTASAVVFQWIQLLNAGAATQFDWKVVPVLNPDGLLPAKATRVNAAGVDLNRNFPTPNWSAEAPRYWNKETGNDPRRFPGKAPLSEPESRWVNDEIQRFKPHVIISVHAPFGVLDFDGPAPAPQRFGRLLLNPVGIYPGSLGNYSGKFKNIPVITIELPNALAMPTEAESSKIWTDMLEWITKNVANPSARS